MIDAFVVVEQVQEHFVTQYGEFVAEQLESCEKCSQEVKFQVPTSSIYSGLYCVDFILNDNGVEPLPFTPESRLEFPEVQYSSGDISVTIKELRWDNVLIDTDVDTISDETINEWFDYWFDLNEVRIQDQPVFGNIIHSISIDGGSLNIDFGSAEPRAFWELINSLEQAGISSVLVQYGE